MINLDKRFRRLGIRTKLVIAFVLLSVVPVALVGGYGAVFSFRLLNRAALDALQAGVSLKAEEVQQFLDTVGEDVLSLSRLPTVRALIDAPPRPPRAAVVPVEHAFLAVSRSRKVYYRIACLDEWGREVARVDFDGQHHEIVAASALQERSGRYYFRDAMGVRPGAIYVSPMDWSEDPGAIELRPRPVLRYATRLVNSRGEPRGIVIVDLGASRVLSQVVSLGRERGDVFLVDTRGVYLARSRPAAPGSGPVVADAGQTLYRDFPREMAVTVLTGRPGTASESGLRGRVLAFAPIHPGPTREPWMVVHAYSKGEVLSSIRSLQILVLGLGAGVLVVAFVVGVLAARHFTRPIAALIRGAEAVAAGDFDRVIRVETNDELEDLSCQFNRMASHLKEHERQLLDARAQAERKAQEAEALRRIGTEISALLSLPRILQLVVEKARELLKSDLAILCLEEPGVGFRVGAVSGPREDLSLRPGEVVEEIECAKVASPEAPCPVVRSMRLPTLVAVPLRSGERKVGNLCVGYHVERVVGQDELAFLDGLANHAAIAIENARLHREVQELAALEERERIGQDLHDGIIQSIYATGLGLAECVRLADEDPREVKPRLEAAIERLDTVIRDVRNYIVGLQPKELEERGLSCSLADLTRGLALNALLRVDLEMEPRIDATLTAEQTGHLFHISREALANVVRHARASRVALTLQREDGTLRLAVEDDGVGFDPERRVGSGQGLRNMTERARRLGGEVTLTSAKGRGTCIAVRLPVEQKP